MAVYRSYKLRNKATKKFAELVNSIPILQINPNSNASSIHLPRGEQNLTCAHIAKGYCKISIMYGLELIQSSHPDQNKMELVPATSKTRC